ncbi:hypothetical protein Hdeb2414_s0010g00344041 [Helianthus debilis subsp. tardiflorus]
MIPDYFLCSNSNRRRIKRSYSMRSSGSGDDRDDRGWTNLHVGARKGDLKEVNAYKLYKFFSLHYLFVCYNKLIIDEAIYVFKS